MDVNSIDSGPLSVQIEDTVILLSGRIMRRFHVMLVIATASESQINFSRSFFSMFLFPFSFSSITYGAGI
jgi:hypothetical protein